MFRSPTIVSGDEYVASRCSKSLKSSKKNLRNVDRAGSVDGDDKYGVETGAYMTSGGSRICKRGPRSSAAGARIDALKAPRGFGLGRGYPLPIFIPSPLGRGHCPSPDKFSVDFESENGDF